MLALLELVRDEFSGGTPAFTLVSERARARTAAISGVIGMSTALPLDFLVLVGSKWITFWASRTCDSRSRRTSVVRWYLQGWYGYFQHAHRYTFSSLDGFVRRRLRAMLRKQKRRPGQGHSFNDHVRWPNSFFASLGLFTMSDAHRLARQSRCGNN
jgi:hypothetical protein